MRLHRELAHDAASPDLVCLLVSQRQCQAGFAACSACAEQSGGRQVHEVGVKPSVQTAGPLWSWRSTLVIVPVTHTVVKLPLGRDLQSGLFVIPDAGDRVNKVVFSKGNTLL